jgi:hypothetical protein
MPSRITCLRLEVSEKPPLVPGTAYDDSIGARLIPAMSNNDIAAVVTINIDFLLRLLAFLLVLISFFNAKNYFDEYI